MHIWTSRRARRLDRPGTPASARNVPSRSASSRGCTTSRKRHGRRELKRGAIGLALKTATTDNGCEVSHQKNLERILGRPVCYTRACDSYEKGAVENVNRIIRRWFPEGTDFSKVRRADVLAVENIVNSIHRRSLNGDSANEYHSRMAKAA